jgi:hypothetical protein
VKHSKGAPWGRCGGGRVVRQQLCCDTPARRIRLGWLSFQPDGAISFGLNDRTYISPKFKAQHFVWSAFNRIGIQYEVQSDPAALEPVRNPHFTFHPPHWFHLKSDGDGALFEAIADVPLALHQDSEMPWLRAVSTPLRQLPTGGRRRDSFSEEEIGIALPHEELSVCIELDLVRAGKIRVTSGPAQWFTPWHGVAIRATLRPAAAQIATLSWFHFH